MTALDITLILLVASVFGVVALRLIHLPPILGYILVGVLLGPHALQLAQQNDSMHILGEMGVVFLMFSIGLEFSLPKLYAMRREVLGLGLAQVCTTIVATIVLSLLISYYLPQIFTISWQAGFALGGALAMSSTAIVSKMLTDKIELESPHGKRMMSVLLFQDLAVVPLLIVVPALAKEDGNLASNLWIALAKASVILFLLFFVGKKVIQQWFTVVVQRRSQELFMLNLLFVTLGCAWLTEKAGLSLALGAFVAGMLISETQFRHQVEEDIKSFRDVLLGLFFISVGMLLDIKMVYNHAGFILLLLLGGMMFKLILLFILAKLFQCGTATALRTGLGLMQAGEFGFVLLNQFGQFQMMDAQLLQHILAAMVISMLLSPLVMMKSDWIVMKLVRNDWMLQSLALTQLATKTMSIKDHVVIAGFGRSGQNLAKMLTKENISYQALDMDIDRIREAQAAGAMVSYGDAARKESLMAVGLHRAKALVISYVDIRSALKILHIAKEINPHIAIIVRSHDDNELEKLREAGATEVVPEIIEGSLMLASHALVMMGVPLRKVVHHVQKARSDRYQSLRGVFHGESDPADDLDYNPIRLHSVVISDGAYAIGKLLQDFPLQAHTVEVDWIMRGKQKFKREDNIILQAQDVVVLRGLIENMSLVEQALLSGS